MNSIKALARGNRRTSASFVLIVLVLLYLRPNATHGQIFTVQHPGGVNPNISEYTTSGTPVNTPLAVIPNNNPIGIAVSGSDIFVSNYSAGTISEYTTSGATVNASLVKGLTGPFALAIAGSDIFVTQGTTIGEYTTSGATVNSSLVSGLNLQFGIAVSGSNIFVNNEYNADGGSFTEISEYAISGTPVNTSLVKFPENADPDAIVASGSDLFVADENLGSISEYTTSGVLINADLVSGLSTPGALAISGSDLFVAYYANDPGGRSAESTIGEYTTDGATINASLVTDTETDAFIAGMAVAVPEPTGLSILFVAAIVALMRRRPDSSKAHYVS